MSNNSTIKIPAQDSVSKPNITQKTGKTFLDIWKQTKSQDPGLQVDMPFAVAGVRGTKFELRVGQYYKDRTEVSVLEGRVWTRRKIEGGKGLEKNATIIGPGQSLEVKQPVRSASEAKPLAIMEWRVDPRSSDNWWNWRDDAGELWKPGFSNELVGAEDNIPYQSDFKPPLVFDPDSQGTNGQAHIGAGHAAQPADEQPAAATAPDAAMQPPAAECGAMAECKEPPLPVKEDPPASTVGAPAAKPEPVKPPVGTPDAAKPEAGKGALDLAFWTSIKDSTNPVLYQGYLAQFPNGTFAVIAREKLKILSVKPAAAPVPAVKPVLKPKPVKLTFSQNGVNGVSGKTPYSVAAIKTLLPGYAITQKTRQVEGDTETYLIAGLDGAEVLAFESNGSTVQSINTKSDQVAGPFGFHVGDQFGQVLQKVKLQNECMRGVESSINKIICSTSDGAFHYVVSIRYEDAREPEVWTLAMIPPQTLLTELRWTVPDVEAPKPAAAPVPVAPARVKGPVLTNAGVGGITAKTPFTLAAITGALPGFSVQAGQVQHEEVTVSAFYVQLKGREIMVVEGNDDNYVSSVKISDPVVTGPSGLHVGDSIAKVRAKVALGECYWGGEEMEGLITCFPPQGRINYIFTPPPSINPEDNNDLKPQTMPAATILSRFDWAAPEPEEAPPGKVSETIPALQPTPAMRVDELLRGGDALLQNNKAAAAMGFFTEAAKKGSAIAHYRIGWLYENGNGVVKTAKGAQAYYERAAALGYLPAYSRLITLQEQNRNLTGAVQTFFRFYKANPVIAMQAHKNWSNDILRTIQVVMKTSGHYQGAVDGRFGPETRAAIAAYVSGKQAVPVAPVQSRPGPDRALDSLAKKLQRQLRRVGCYNGPVDGKWGSGSSRALRNFNHWAGLDLPIGVPTARALRVLTMEREEICGFD